MDLGMLHPPPVLHAEGLHLEPLRVDHAEEMSVVLHDVRLHTWTGGELATVEQLRARYARQVPGRSEDGLQAWLNWVVRSADDGVALGYVQATVEVRDDEPVAHLAWVVAVPHQGAGRRAAAAMLAWLRAKGVSRFVADVHPGHAASRGVARALGMQQSSEVVDGEDRWAVG